MKYKILIKLKRKCFKRLVLFLFLAIQHPSNAFSLETEKCSGVLELQNLPPQLDQAVEDYSFHLSTVVSIYSGLYHTIEKKCPGLVDETFEWKKGIVIAKLHQDYPDNQITKRYAFKECLLSHFYFRDWHFDPSLRYMSSMLDQSLPIFEQMLKRAQDAAKASKVTVDSDKLCKFAFELTIPDDISELTQLGKQILQLEQTAQQGISSANARIKSFCKENVC